MILTQIKQIRINYSLWSNDFKSTVSVINVFCLKTTQTRQGLPVVMVELMSDRRTVGWSKMWHSIRTLPDRGKDLFGQRQVISWTHDFSKELSREREGGRKEEEESNNLVQLISAVPPNQSIYARIEKIDNDDFLPILISKLGNNEAKFSCHI